MAPTAGAGSDWQSAGFGSTQTSYGFRTVSDPSWPGANADGSDLLGYLVERASNHLPPTYNQTGYDGYDFNYSQFALTLIAKFYIANRDPPLLKLMNAILNMAMWVKAADGTTPRANKTTWIGDGTGGSRQTNSLVIDPSGPFVATWLAGRTLFSASDLAGLFNREVQNFYDNIATPNNILYRGLSVYLGTVLQASSFWPGLPS